MPGTRHNSAAATGGSSRHRRSNGNSQPADWATASSVTVLVLIANVTANGAAVQFGYSRDGGAYSLRFVGDGEPYTEWIRPNEDLDAILEEIAGNWYIGAAHLEPPPAA